MNSLRSCAEKITPGSDSELNLIQRHEKVTYVEEKETEFKKPSSEERWKKQKETIKNSIDMKFTLIS